MLLQRFVTAALRTVDDDSVLLVFNTLPPATTSSLHQYLEVLFQRFVTAALRTVDDDGVPLVFNTLPTTTTSSLHQYL